MGGGGTDGELFFVAADGNDGRADRDHADWQTLNPRSVRSFRRWLAAGANITIGWLTLRTPSLATADF